MSADRVGSRFGDGCSAFVTRLIFRSVGLQHRSDPTGLGSDLNIIKPDSTGLSSTRHCNVQTLQIAVNITIYILSDVTEILIATRFVINCPLHRIM